MALPPKGDPRRPLVLAIRSTRLFGILFLLFGLCSTLPMLMMRGRFMGMRGAGSGGISLIMLAVYVVMPMLVYFGPGIAYLITSVYLGRRTGWAIVLGLVVTSIHLLMMLLAGVGVGAMIVSVSQDPRQSGIIMVVLAATLVCVFIAALIQLLYHLAKSFEAIKYVPPDTQYGFEPIVSAQVAPSPATPTPSAPGNTL
jgi:hypothetical protein